MNRALATLDDVTQRVRELLAELLQVDVSEIDVNDAIVEGDDSDSLELDSLDALKFALVLADEYDLSEPSDLDIHKARTVGDVAAVVHTLASGQPQFT